MIFGLILKEKVISNFNNIWLIMKFNVKDLKRQVIINILLLLKNLAWHYWKGIKKKREKEEWIEPN